MKSAFVNETRKDESIGPLWVITIAMGVFFVTTVMVFIIG